MKTGYLYHARNGLQLYKAIELAVEAYRKKTGTDADCVYINKDDFVSGDLNLSGLEKIKIHGVNHILRNHIWIGKEDEQK